jgi:hypothetical protein
MVKVKIYEVDAIPSPFSLAQQQVWIDNKCWVSTSHLTHMYLHFIPACEVAIEIQSIP